MNKVLNQLCLGKQSDYDFRFCGREFRQDKETFAIHVTCEKTTEKIAPISISPQRALQKSEPITPLERTQLLSVAGSMSWVVRSCRPEESYAVSCAQQQRNKATVQQLLDVNQAVIDLQADPKRGLTYLPGIDWYNATLGVIADASHAGEVEWIDDWKELEAFRSQGARILVIADKAIAQNKPGMFHAIGYGSTVIRRVCRATVQSEGYNLESAVEEGDLLRAAIIDARGLLDHADWENSAAASMTMDWFTDCKSVRDALSKPTLSKITDKRLGITFAAMRMSLWRKPGGGLMPPRLTETRPEQTTDAIHWIDTAVMLCDPMTKQMSRTYLQAALDTNIWDPRQPAESKATKERKQQQRKKKPEDAPEQIERSD
jgi:hypothetical protein